MPLLIRLLRTAWDDTRNLPLAEFDESQIQWTIDSGLGPLLFRATQNDTCGALPTWRESLLSANLTAQVLMGDLIDAMSEIIDACEEAGTRLTLLKGISICKQH